MYIKQNELGKAVFHKEVVFDQHREFDDKALFYKQYRPSYPSGAVDLILSLSNHKRVNIADIGSGTGKLSSLLIKDNTVVFAVEPNTEMRTIAEKDLSSHKNYLSIHGTGEATTLTSDSIDIITVAEAYHWFDNDRSKIEFRRILKQNGFVVLLWNQFGGNPYDDDMSEINKRWCSIYKEKRARIPHEDRAIHLFGKGNYHKTTFDNTIKESLEAFLGGILSASYALKESDENFTQYIAEISKTFDEYSDNGLIESKITTSCFYGQL